MANADRDALLRMATELEAIERIEVVKQGGPERMVVLPSWFADAFSKALRSIAGGMNERKIL